MAVPIPIHSHSSHAPVPVGAGRGPHVITVTSGKGGVGKTNFTANVAWQLRQTKRRVLIMDADLGLANIDIVYGLAPEFNMSHVLAGEKSLEEVLVKGPGGVMILPASSGVMEMTDLSETQKLVLLQQLEQLGAAFDYVLIDTSAGIGGNVVYFALAAQTIIVVLTPEPTSMADGYALIKVLSTMYHQTEFKVMVNEVTGEHEALEIFKKLTTVTDRFLNVAVDFVGWLPRDSKVRDAVRSQRPFMDLYPRSAAAQGIKKIARQIVTMENDPMKSDLGLLWRNVLMTPAA